MGELINGTCGFGSCPNPVSVRGLCEHHYRRRVHYGVFRLVDGAPVVAHLEVLRGLGWTWQQIGDAAGVSPSQPCALAGGRYKRMRREVADALLAIPAVPVRSHRGMDATGARRRLQALQWMGWPMREIVARLDPSPRDLPSQVYDNRMSTALVVDIARVYDELSHLPGPSKCSATKARRSGYAPPAAWDETTINDPRARPSGVRRDAA